MDKAEEGLHSFLKKATESPKGQMKRRLLQWGNTLDYCSRKQEEMKRFLRLREDCVCLAEKQGSVNLVQDLIKSYEEEVKRIQEGIEDTLKEKAKMDQALEKLSMEERELIYLRYGKGYSHDYIAMKKNMSRATCFRILDKALNILLEEKS